MKLLNFYCLFFLIISVNCGYDFPLKTKVIGKFRQWLCSWLDVGQYNTIAGKLEDFVTPNTTVDQLKSEIIKVGMETLTSSQKITLATFAGKFVTKYGNYDGAMSVLGTVLASNMQPFSNQLSEMWNKYESQGKTRNRIFQRGYKMADMFVTQKRVGTIYCRLKIAFNNYNASMWPFIKQNMNNIILFSVLDGLGTSCA